MKMTAIAIIGGTLATLIAATCAVSTDADARRLGGVYARPYVHAGQIRRYPAARGAYWRRGAGRWVNGVWVVNGVAASVAVGTASNCAYYWRNWQATGRPYWRERYNEMCG